MDIAWGEKATNIAVAESFIRSADATLVVLPEMFSTGFMAADTSLAEPMEGETVAWMSRIAQETGRAVTGSVIIIDAGSEKPYNRLIFATPDGRIQSYDKHHLFSYSGENQFYAAGSERVVFEYAGFRILPLVCYDLRFPVWSRNRNDYDLILYVASWPKSRIEVWNALLRARAIENQCYVIGVNRVGSDPVAQYDGHSAVVDFYGHTVASFPAGVQGALCAELNVDLLREFREKFRAWEDADNFQIM